MARKSDMLISLFLSILVGVRGEKKNKEYSSRAVTGRT